LSAAVTGVVHSCGFALQSKTMVGAAEGPDVPADGRTVLWPLSSWEGSFVTWPTPEADGGIAGGGAFCADAAPDRTMPKASSDISANLPIRGRLAAETM